MISQRYEKNQSIVLTSNKAFADWGEVFGGDAVMAGAALDRLLHRATVLNIRGESYRMKDRRKADSRSAQQAGHRRRDKPQSGREPGEEVTA